MLCTVKLYVSAIMIYCAWRKFLSGHDLIIALGTGTGTGTHNNVAAQLHLPKQRIPHVYEGVRFK